MRAQNNWRRLVLESDSHMRSLEINMWPATGRMYWDTSGWVLLAVLLEVITICRPCWVQDSQCNLALASPRGPIWQIRYVLRKLIVLCKWKIQSFGDASYSEQNGVCSKPREIGNWWFDDISLTCYWADVLKYIWMSPFGGITRSYNYM
jgi:hypothetical protein